MFQSLTSYFAFTIVPALLAAAPLVVHAQGFPQAAPPYRTGARSEVFEPAETVARVGNQHIFRGDLEGDANIVLIPTLERMPADKREEAEPQIRAQREKLVQQALREAIQRKLMYEKFLKSIPAEKLDEAMANINERVGEQFTKSLDEMVEKLNQADSSETKDLARQSSQLFRLAFVMKELDLATFRELDLLLRRHGSSLEKQQQAYKEDQLGRQELYGEARDTAEVTYDDMVEYYQQNISDFNVETRARWEQITIKFDQFPTKFAAGDAIAKLGNELFYGAPFKQLAMRSSQGDKASEGGYHDWTEWGNFKVSREINEAVFSINPGELSKIIIDAEGLHIVRVIEREEAHVIPFADAQSTIKNRIEGDRRTNAINKYLADLQERIPVWTIYDEPEPTDQIANPPRTNRVR